MASLEENIERAIAFADSVEQVIVESGIEVPDGADVEEYPELLRMAIAKGLTVDQTYNPESTNPQSGIAVAEALASQPIKYLESLDSENYGNLYDLESGMYVLYGTFLVYPNATKKFVFSKKLFVAVSHGTISTCIQVLYPAYNTLQYLNIWKDENSETGYDYERKDAQLYYSEDTRQKVTELDESATDEQYPSAKAVYDKVKETSNAIKATASGEVIRVDDVSPIVHTAKAKVSGKNKFNTNIIKTYSANNSAYISEVGNGYVVIDTKVSNTYCSTQKTLGELCPDIIVGETYTLSGSTEATDAKYIYLAGNVKASWKYGVAKVVTEDMLNALVVMYGVGNTTCRIENIQLEIGDTATEYEPYIDPTTVKVTRCGKNIIPYPYKEQNITRSGIEFSVDEQGVISASGTSNGAYLQLCTRDDKKIYLHAGKTYYLSGVASGGSLQTQYAYLTDAAGQAYFDIGDGIIITPEESGYAAVTVVIKTDTEVTNVVFKPLLEVGDNVSEFEPYNAKTYTPKADGTVDILTVSPTMTLLTDTAGVNIDVEYNQDTNAFADGVKSDLRELDNVTAELAANMGDVETALDSIIAMQESLIGGDTV